MQIILIPRSHLHVPADRQRKEFNPESINTLADSIQSAGLIHPLIVRRTGDAFELVAGERRLRAIEQTWAFGRSFRCAGSAVAEGSIPCLEQGSLTDLEAFEIELEENIQRADLTWQERAKATAQLMELRKLQAEKLGKPVESVLKKGREDKISKQMRAYWVGASLDGKLNWMAGKVTG